jgi:hypothetical protein
LGGCHGVDDSLGRIGPHQFDEIPYRTVRLPRRLTFRGVVSSSYCREEHTIQPAGKLGDLTAGRRSRARLLPAGHDNEGSSHGIVRADNRTDPARTAAGCGTGREWILDPSRSTVSLRSRILGLVPVNGVFREVTGQGTVSPTGEVSGAITVVAASIDTENTIGRQAGVQDVLLWRDAAAVGYQELPAGIGCERPRFPVM